MTKVQVLKLASRVCRLGVLVIVYWCAILPSSCQALIPKLSVLTALSPKPNLGSAHFIEHLIAARLHEGC